MDYRKKFIVATDEKLRLADIDPDDTQDQGSDSEAADLTEQYRQKLADMQTLLYAENKRALLIVLQAMDAGGKDGTISHVMRAMNPQGVSVSRFEAPTPEERAHDFLWRIHSKVPRLSQVGVFNRSHYEDVVIVRVHNLVPKDVWSHRYDQINAMLLNEFLKEHRKVQELQATVAEQKQGIQVLMRRLEEQAGQIQKVNARIDLAEPSLRVIASKH